MIVDVGPLGIPGIDVINRDLIRDVHVVSEAVDSEVFDPDIAAVRISTVL
jgi:hypothetical protein